MDMLLARTRPVGRPARPIIYKEVTYNGVEYIVGTLTTIDGPVKFVFDKEDHPKMKDFSWHLTAGYVSHNVNVGESAKALYLHNLIMGRIVFPGKGTRESVDHINRIKLDNRKANLRICSQSEQNLNKSARKRVAELPEDSGLTIVDLPKHIWYIKANGTHGDRFAIEIKTEGIAWKTTSSRIVSLKDKLAVAKAKLAEYYTEYPHLDPDAMTMEEEDLLASYNAIVGAVNDDADDTE